MAAGAAPLAVCSQPEGSPRDSFASEQQLREQLVGQWLSCNSPRWETRVQNHVGFEFTTDGKWFVLLRDKSGAIVRGQGFDYEGTFQILDTSMMNGPGRYQVNMKYNGGGTSIASPIFSDAPRKMRLNGSGGAVTYVPAQ